MNKKIINSGLAFFGTLLFFSLLGLLTGSLALGLFEIILIAAIIAVELFFIWRPRHRVE